MDICFVRANHYRAEPRLSNLLDATKEMNRGAILWDRQQDAASKEPFPCAILSLKAPFGKKTLALMPIWFLYVFFQLIRFRPRIVHACNLESALPAWIFCFLFRKKLVYDIWDTAAGMYASSNENLKQHLNQLEQRIIKSSAAVLVPDFERFSQLGYPPNAYPEHALVIENSQIHLFTGKRHCAAENNTFQFLYIGVLSKEVRGLEFLIECAGEFPGAQITIAGYGSDAPYIKELAAQSKASNLHFLGKVDRTQANHLLEETDCIISLLDPTFENYTFATSTKIFEAFAHGKPVITTEQTASGALVTNTHWGVAIPYRQADLFRTIASILEGSLTFELDSSRVERYDWRHSQDRLLQCYHQLLK